MIVLDWRSCSVYRSQLGVVDFRVRRACVRVYRKPMAIKHPFLSCSADFRWHQLNGLHFRPLLLCCVLITILVQIVVCRLRCSVFIFIHKLYIPFYMDLMRYILRIFNFWICCSLQFRIRFWRERKRKNTWARHHSMLPFNINWKSVILEFFFRHFGIFE